MNYQMADQPFNQYIKLNHNYPFKIKIKAIFLFELILFVISIIKIGGKKKYSHYNSTKIRKILNKICLCSLKINFENNDRM